MIVGRRILREKEVTSTNEVVKRFGKEGEAEGLVVVAETQAKGRGRMGRSWASPRGGLYLSILLRPNVQTKELLKMTVFSCVPVAKAIEDVAGVEVTVKWPNDLEVNGKKVGGILTEGVTIGSTVRFVVLGLGINVNSKAIDIQVPEATSLSEITGKQIDKEALLGSLLKELDAFYLDFIEGKLKDEEYVARSSILGKNVEAMVGEERFIGKALYVNDDGALVLKSDEGLILRLTWVNDTHIRLIEEAADIENKGRDDG